MFILGVAVHIIILRKKYLYQEKLIKQLKKEVKHLMEESVAKKTVHEESSNVTAVCSTVDTCLSLGMLSTLCIYIFIKSIGF